MFVPIYLLLQTRNLCVESSQVLQYEDKTFSCRAVWHIVGSLRTERRSQQLIPQHQSVGSQQLERFLARRRGHLSLTAMERLLEKLDRLMRRRWPVELWFHLTIVHRRFTSPPVRVTFTHSHPTISPGHVSANLSRSPRCVCILSHYFKLFSNWPYTDTGYSISYWT